MGHMEATIEVAGLRKSFRPTVALDGVSFTALPGQVTGFVGPNGAGKSTTVRVILGLDPTDAGSALVGGQPLPELAVPAEPRRGAGRLILPGHGFTPAHGYPPLSLGDGPVLCPAVRMTMLTVIAAE